MGFRKLVCRQVHWMMDGMMGMARGMMPGALAVDGLRVDVTEDMDDVVVIADLPGVEKENIAIRLLSPTELRITGVRCSETAESASEGRILHLERACGRMDRVVPLPGDATAECARASLENGVLRVRLRKAMAARGERIPIE